MGELQSLRHKFQCQQGRLQEILVCLDVGMSYLHDPRQLKDYFAVGAFRFYTDTDTDKPNALFYRLFTTSIATRNSSVVHPIAVPRHRQQLPHQANVVC